MKVEHTKYYLGFDIGTDSVGYAVTDENYNILKFNGKAMWGSRLFDEAKTAEGRRGFRSNRRRLSRRRQRIELLQELFSEEIQKVDAGFFQRLKDSALFPEDKAVSQTYSLFSDKSYSDIEYYNEFPTIYHLRKKLILTDEKQDIRLIYLALHHIMKHRGHFLFHGSFDNVTSLRSLIDRLQVSMEENFGIVIECTEIDKLEQILRDRYMSKKDKTSEVIKLLKVGGEAEKVTERQVKEIIKLICGCKVKVADVYADESLKEIEKASISFTEASYEETYVVLQGELEERIAFLDVVKGVYDWAVLADILEGGECEDKSYLSVAKVRKYEKHHSDLEKLKKIVKDYSTEEYRKLFQSIENSSYSAYIGYTKKNGVKKSVERCGEKVFFDNIKKILKQIENTACNVELVEYISTEIEAGTFLPLHVGKDNGVIPYQIHEMELQKILENAEKHYAFLGQADEAGKTVSDKIKAIFTFRIPYYVGPLNTANSENAWFVRKEKGVIRPWNFEEKVDLDASAEKFIRRMTNKCTYLIGKDVLPKNSLLYSEFMVWNELNNVKIGSEKLADSLRKKIVEEVFKREKKVTKKRLCKFLLTEGVEFDEAELSGFDNDFKASLTSYLDMKKIFGDDIKKYSVQQMIEKLILWITLYGEDSKMLKRVIRKNYSTSEISDEQVKKVCRLKYQGWGRLSKEFLTELEGVDIETGEVFNIMGALKETGNNLMQLLSNRYTFHEVLLEKNTVAVSDECKISYDNLVKDLVASPAIKRAVWQVVLIAEEIRKIMKCEPAKIFIEVARGAQEKERMVSRKDRLIKLYESIKDESRDWKKELENTPESEFRSIKLYLYYTQMGKCMYSGETIELSRLMDTTVYDRDHIYPQSKTKDDSLDNLVLVKKEINAKKGNEVLSEEIQKKMCGFWKGLKEKGLISDIKYQRLMRKTPLTDDELAGFINRQLVETRQSTKVVADLFQRMYKSEVVYVKAAAVSEFRKKELDMVKVRSMNDLHHAKDAYLNIVVGNVYHEKFTKNPLKWLKSHPNQEYSLNHMFDFDIVIKDKLIWKRGKNGTISVIRKNMQLRDIRYTRYATENKSGQNGGFFDQKIVARDNNPSVPIKKGMDVLKYGGYKTITSAYFALVESEDKKGKKQRSVEAVPLYLEKEIQKNNEVYLTYCREVYNLVNPKVILPKIKKDSYLVIDGFPMHLRGTTGKQLFLQNAVQLYLPEEEEKYLKKIEKYIQRNTQSTDKNLIKISEYDGVSKESSIVLYDALCEKQNNTIYQYRPANQYKNLVNGREKFMELSAEEQCVVLNEVLHLLQCKPLAAKLSNIGGGSSAGRVMTNKFISSCKTAILVHQSVTGLFEQEINLLTVGQEDDLRKI